MSDERPPEVPSGSADPAESGAPEPAWVRRRRLAAVFGDVLPEGTRDDASEPGTERGAEGSEEWLRRQVPPHHG